MPSIFHVSERSHSGFLCMTELARFYGEDRYLSLQEIADDLGSAQSYLEEIALLLKQAGLVIGKKGPHGGYRLARPPTEITADMMLTALEGPLAFVECQGKEKICPVQDRCHSRGFWGLLQTQLRLTLRSTTLADMLTL